jgi:hypothetical protein
LSRKVHKLAVRPDYEFFLIGIASHENDYRLSWALNMTFGFNFSRINNLSVGSNQLSSIREFSVFSYEDEDSQMRYNLVSNRCNDGFLIDEMKNIDFWLQIFGEANKLFLSTFCSSLKKIEIVSAAFEIDPQSLKSRSSLIF